VVAHHTYFGAETGRVGVGVRTYTVLVWVQADQQHQDAEDD
jgi:hypothetical protein